MLLLSQPRTMTIPCSTVTAVRFAQAEDNKQCDRVIRDGSHGVCSLGKCNKRFDKRVAVTA